ncbi:hypothetical protein ES705_23273 [subsurface metagenome]
MIDFKLKYQAILFMNISDLQANNENIRIYMELFSGKDLIPNIIQEFKPPSPVPQNRLRLSSQNNEWAISFGSYRIDIEKNPIDKKGSNLGEVTTFCKDALSDFKKILQVKPRKANRLALVTRFLAKEMTEDQLITIYKKLFKSPQTYTDPIPFEWNWRLVSLIDKTINELPEKVNYITALNRVSGEITDTEEVTPLERIDMNFDINTTAKTVEDRFGTKEIKFFFENVDTWHKDLLDEITEFLS